MFYRFLLLIVFLSLPFGLEAEEYVIIYQSLSSGSLFHIETKEGKKVGKVVRERKNRTIYYSFYNADELLTAQGKLEKEDTETTLFVSDSEGNDLGSFIAEIYNVYPTQYQVFSNRQILVAKGWLNWLGSSFTLVDPNIPKRYLVSYFRPMFKLFNDYWHFDIHEKDVIDFRIVVFIGVFQSACDLKFEKLNFG